MKTFWASLEADVVMGGASTRPWQATGIALNLDEVVPGSLFFAQHSADIARAIALGAAAVVKRRGSLEPAIASAAMQGAAIVAVPDVYQALRDLAHAARFRTHAFVVALPGAGLRVALSKELCRKAPVFMAGRHFSQSLAAMPDNAGFALFGCVNGLRPDLALVSEARGPHAAVIEDMPKTGIVLVCSDDPYYAEAVARARACGLQRIITISGAEARNPAALAGIINSALHHPAGRVNVASISGFQPRMLAFKIANLIELPGGLRTYILGGRPHGPRLAQARAPFSYVCAGGGKSVAGQNVPALEEVSPDVLKPGDVVLFERQHTHTAFTAAFRSKTVKAMMR